MLNLYLKIVFSLSISNNYVIDPNFFHDVIVGFDKDVLR